MSTHDVKITCTETIHSNRINEFVYESLAKWDALNKVHHFTEMSLSFPDNEIILCIDKAMKETVDILFDCVIEYCSEHNRVEVFICPADPVTPGAKPRKIFSGKFLK